MNLDVSPTLGNELLSALPPTEMARLHPSLTRMRLVNGQGLYEAGERIEHVFFFERGLASMVAQADNGGDGVGVGLIGREGMVGFPVLLNRPATSYNKVMVQAPGGALRMSASALRDTLDDLPVLRHLLFQALEVSMAQVAQIAACSSQHHMLQRLARLLLMVHDRVDGDELVFSQDALATMLGVRRSGVTITLASLQAEGLVQMRRGRSIICDRPGLEAAACGCYGYVQAFAAVVAAQRPDPMVDLAA